MEKRQSPRIKVILPTEIELYDESLRNTQTLQGDLVDLSQGGISVVVSEKISESFLKGGKLTIDIPPCYSTDPNNAIPIEVSSEICWYKPKAHNTQFQYGVRFLDVNDDVRRVLQKVVTAGQQQEESKTPKGDCQRPLFTIYRGIHSCNMYSVDLTIGCEHKCTYCHYSEVNKERYKQQFPYLKDFPVPVDMAPLYQLNKLPDSAVYLSPTSDAFAPAARDLTHELLSYLLPKGVIFVISTKAIIPDKTIALMRKYSQYIEDIAMGVTSMNEQRNKILEPGCLSAYERLAHVKDLLSIGCVVFVRMDPMLPLIDDTAESLQEVIGAVSKTGIKHITGAYVISYGSMMKQMKENSYLSKSIDCLTEKSYPVGGKAYSLPLEERRKTYALMNQMCKSYGITFHTCGCKEARLKSEGYPLICREMSYYKEKKSTGDDRP